MFRLSLNKILIITFVISVIGISYYVKISNNSVQQLSPQPQSEQQEYRRYSNQKLPFSFEYPSSWKIKAESEETSIAQQIKIENPNEFSIYLRSEKIGTAVCPPTIPCEVGQPHIYYPFNIDSFEQVETIDNKKLYVAKSGSETRDNINIQGQNEYAYVDKVPSIGSLNYVLEEKGDMLTEELTIFNHGGKRDSLLIYYIFRNEEAIKKWPEYKEILKHIINSMEAK